MTHNKVHEFVLPDGTKVDIVDANIIRIQGNDGRVIWYVIHPVTGAQVEIDPEQEWFWTTEWQSGEREVDDELRTGNYEEFDDIDDFIDSL